MKSDQVNGFGARLRRLRQEAGLSQQDLAGPGLSASYLSLLESGRREPTPAALQRLSQRLGTTPDELLHGQERRDERLTLAHAELELSTGESRRAVQTFGSLLSSADPEVADRARWGLAAAQEARGDLASAIAVYEEIRADVTGSRTAPFVRSSLALSRCCREAGDLARACDVAEQALAAIARYGLEDSDLEVSLLCTLAGAHQERGDLVRAGHVLDRARALAEDLGSPRARGAAYWNASSVAAELGQLGDAVDLAGRALALFGEGDDVRNLARLRQTYAYHLLRHDPRQADVALAALERAHAVLREAGSEIDLAYCETESSRALAVLGRAEEAERSALSALQRLGDQGRTEAAHARQALGYALWTAGRTVEAAAHYQRAALDLESLGSPRQAAEAWSELAELDAERGRQQEAAAATARALRLLGVGMSLPVPSPQPQAPGAVVRSATAPAPR